MNVRLTVALLMSFLLLGSLACGGREKPEQSSNRSGGLEVGSTPALAPMVGDPGDETGDKPDVGVLEASIAVRFDSIEELADSADLAVIGSVQSTTSTSFQGLPFTLSKFVVDETVFGEVKADQVISVVETGGLFSGRSKVPGEEGTLAEPVEVALEGVPVMKTGERWLLVLWHYEGPIEEAGYIPAGEFQGKFRVGTSGVIEFTGDATRLDNPHFETAKLAQSLPVEDLVSKLRSSKS